MLAFDSQMELEEVPILRAGPQQETEIPIVSDSSHSLPTKPQIRRSYPCAFSKQEINDSESEQRSKSSIKLVVLIIFYILVMILEIVGGIRANSLAVITDAAHLLTDVATFSISLFSLWASGWHANSRQTFGYNRIEVLGALASVQIIWTISGYLIYESIERLSERQEKVDGKLMFGVAAIGFIVNLIMVLWLGHNHGHHDHHHSHHDHSHDHHHSHHDHSHQDLEKVEIVAIRKGGKTMVSGQNYAHNNHNHDDHPHHGHEKLEIGAIAEEEKESLVLGSKKKYNMLNINVQGAYLHVMADIIQSIGVMIAGVIIWTKPSWLAVDLVCTLIFSLFAIGTTLPMLKRVVGILLERTPEHIDIEKLENSLKYIKGVQDIHDLHVWSISVGKVVMSCHVIAENCVSSSELIYRIRDHCQKKHNIVHVTVQVEQ